MKLFTLVLIVSLSQVTSAFAYSCRAKSVGGSQCGGSYSGYHAQSKGLAIQDALDNCASSAPSGCTCVYESCTDLNRAEKTPQKVPIEF